MTRSIRAILAAVTFAISTPAVIAAEGAPDAGLIRDGLTEDLATYQWVKRPLVVFSDTPADPRFLRQLALIEAEAQALIERDVVVLTDTDPEAQSALRTKLRPRGFILALIGKDGGIKLRKPFPWNVRELSRVIDKMPLRQQEIRERRGTE